MVKIFQRFDQRMWGIDSDETRIVSMNGIKFELENVTRPAPKFNKTRRTCTGDARRVIPLEREPSILEQTSSPYFFKAYWVECSRTKEPVIVEEAHRRAELYLGELKSFVLDHIPRIEYWEERKQTSTDIIRDLVGKSSRSRAQIVLVAQKLTKLAPLDGKQFYPAFWDIVRCALFIVLPWTFGKSLTGNETGHYLLWRIGVVHGDISLDNLLYDTNKEKGILNDFDMSRLMQAGQDIPDWEGEERTGTREFMALDLLNEHKKNLLRGYRHDLESFAWCLAHTCFSENTRDWKRGRHFNTSGGKCDFMMHVQRFHGRREEKIVNVTRSWLHYIMEDIKHRKAKEPSVQESLQLVIDCLHEKPFQDTTWIDFHVPL